MKRMNALVGTVGGIAVGSGIMLALSVMAEQRESPAPVADRITVDATPPDRDAPGALGGYADIVSRVSPSVVSVFASREVETAAPAGFDSFGSSPFRRFFEDRDLERFFGAPRPGERARPQRPMPAPREQGLGSGVILTPDGYILTNNHVVDGADDLEVVLEDGGKRYDAEIVGRDPQSDLAVLKIDAQNLPAATIGDSTLLLPGDTVLAIGNPFGLNKTVTSGIVSAIGRNNLNITGYEDFIQTDASINPGNSGGALVDNRGRVVGVNTAIFSRTGGNVGIGFAIPINMAVEIAGDLMQDGVVERGYLGVLIGPLTPELAQALDVDANKGALVNEVLPDTPAARAGLENGDVVVSANGEAVRNAAQFRLLVGSLDPGESLELVVMRDGREKGLAVTIGKLDPDQVAAADGIRPSAPAKPSSTIVEGAEVAELTDAVRKEFGVDEGIAAGLVVTTVEPGSKAAEAGLRPGDVITEIGRQPVKDLGDAAKARKEVRNDMLLLRVASANGSRYLAVEVS